MEVSDPLRPLAEVFKPDVREPNLGQTLPEIHAFLTAMTLHDDVPVGVRQLFETAKNARLYTWFVYPFHQVTEMLAYQALERALKEHWNIETRRYASVDDAGFKSPGLSALLRKAGREGWIHNEGFSGRQWRAEKAILAERAESAIRLLDKSCADTVEIAEPTDQEIAERAVRIDVVAALVAALPKMRNSLAHGSTKLAPISDAVLRDVRDAINMIFRPNRS